MPAALVAALLFAQLASSGGASRPPECVSLEAPGGANVWERAKSPSLRRYCDRLAAASAKLALETREALVAADDAAAAEPDRAAPLVLRGRGLARLGLWSDAVEALGEARSKDADALEDPSALLAWARSLAHLGRVDEARAAFASLAPRVSALPETDRASAELEAALSAEARGADFLPDAIALLRQAAHDGRDAVAGLATEALALALDRAGEREESRVVLASPRRGGVAMGPMLVAVLTATTGLAPDDGRVAAILDDAAVPYERDAMDAIALERAGAPSARDAWERYASGPGGKGPWAEHARLRVRTGAPRSGR